MLALVTMNTLVLFASLGMFYAIVIRGVSTNQMLVIVNLYALLAAGWLVAILRVFRPRASNWPTTTNVTIT